MFPRHAIQNILHYQAQFSGSLVNYSFKTKLLRDQREIYFEENKSLILKNVSVKKLAGIEAPLLCTKDVEFSGH